MMIGKSAKFEVRLVRTADELHAAQRLRYDVFVSELGGGGTLVDHDRRLERDRYDDFVDHLVLIDKKNGRTIGVYRLLRRSMAEGAGGFYSENEYDLTLLKQSGREILELGRSCLHRDYRGGMAMHQLWTGLADYVATHRIEILFGVASFHGTDIKALVQPLSLLHHAYLAPPELRVRALDGAYQDMNLIPADDLDRHRALVQVPSLIKAYLRLGGRVGEGAFIDHDFNTTDVFLMMDTAQLSQRKAQIYGGAPA
jgi:putative hemolysin